MYSHVVLAVLGSMCVCVCLYVVGTTALCMVFCNVINIHRLADEMLPVHVYVGLYTCYAFCTLCVRSCVYRVSFRSSPPGTGMRCTGMRCECLYETHVSSLCWLFNDIRHYSYVVIPRGGQDKCASVCRHTHTLLLRGSVHISRRATRDKTEQGYLTITWPWRNTATRRVTFMPSCVSP